MNTGTGTFTIGTNNNVANDRYFNVVIGATNELVLAPMTANIAILGAIKNNGSNASALTVYGNNSVLLNGTVASQSASLYTGPTWVNGGTLQVANASAINNTSGITINGTGSKYLHTSSVAGTKPITITRGTLDGTGSVGAVTVANNSGSVVANGNGGTTALTVASLTFNGAATMNLSRASGVSVAVTGALATTPANGLVTINGSGTWSNGLNNLISFGSFGGSIADFTLGTITGLNARQSVGALSLNGSNIALNVTGDTPKWTGLVSSEWSTAAIASPKNWKLFNAGTETDFIASDNVLFDDSATGTTTVDITAANVNPASTTFSNSSLTYTLQSSGGFGIASGTLTKSGTGTVIITNVNSSTGATTINAGTLQLGNGTVDGSLASSGITNNGSLVYNVATAQSYGNVISGTGSVTKSGPGTLTLNGNNNYAGGTTINSGTLTMTAGALGTGNIAVASGATLNVNNNLTINAGQAVTGGGTINNTGSFTVNGDFTGFTGSYTHNSTTVSTGLNTATATSKDAAYTIASNQGSAQGMVVAGNGNYVLEMGSLSGVQSSLIRGGNSATGTSTLKIGNLNTNTTFGGSINNGATKILALEKVGTGTLILDLASPGMSTFSGGTTVTAGKLIVNSAFSSTSNNVTVNGGTLGGSGSIAAAVVVNAGGTIAPGNSIGTFTVGSATIGGIFAVEYDGTGAGSIDLLNVTGALDISAATVDFSQLGAAADDAAYVFATYGSLSGTPTFASATNIPAGYAINYAYSGNNIALVSVPEPTTLAGLAGAALLTLGRRGRKNGR
ncbi:MAG: autotransporter-associated beta strand repeat-containing protein [Tepidisphaeraceae bacterium]